MQTRFFVPAAGAALQAGGMTRRGLVPAPAHRLSLVTQAHTEGGSITRQALGN